MSREVVVASAVRTAIGTLGGSLKDIPPIELAALVVRESLSRARTDGQEVGHVVLGHVVNTGPGDICLSRIATLKGGCAEGTQAFNVNRSAVRRRARSPVHGGRADTGIAAIRDGMQGRARCLPVKAKKKPLGMSRGAFIW